jgi:site-specific DNA recombinase
MVKSSLPVYAGCYVRVSTDVQIENYSIEEQTERLKAYCKAKDLPIFKIYTDPGFSGGNLDRPALRQMLQDIKSKKITVVVVYKLDRLSRSQKDTLMLIEDKFLAAKVDFISVSENFDTSTPFGKAMIGILSVFAQLEKDQITERFTMGRIGRSKAGFYHGGPTPPTGYNYVDGLLVVDDFKALQVKEVFSRFLAGYSVNSIQAYMHSQYGGWGSHALILSVLRNSTYTGKVKFKGLESAGNHVAIIDIDTFERVRALLGSSGRESGKTTSQKTPFRAGYLLSSLVVCGHCGARYSANHGFYRCYSRSKSDKKYITDPNCKNHNWEIEKLDALVIEQINRLRYDQTYLDEILSFKEPAAPSNGEVIAHRIKELTAQIEKVLDLYQLGTLPIEQISDRVNRLQTEKATLEESLVIQVPDSGQARQRFVATLENIDKITSNIDIAEKRMLVASLIESVQINQSTVNIYWRV